MSAFATAIDAIFGDPNMAVDAVWREQGVGPVTNVRIIRKSPDDITDFGAARILTETTAVDVRVSEIALPRINDRLDIGLERFVIQANPRRDRERLVWTLDLRPA